jgi:16S rRNA (cytidine1402-2'-O)-methyltransferase
VRRLLSGESIALITDAGTPLLSDPGARLVNAAIEAGIDVIPVPGASALLAALVASGIAGDQFTFFGFLPRKGKERLRTLSDIMRLEHAAVLYESPLRVGDTLAELANAGAAKRHAVVARELTKKFEEFARGTVSELAARFSEHPARGEVVILIGGAQAEAPDRTTLESIAREMRLEGIPPREIAEKLARDHGASRNLAYQLAHSE